MSSNEWQKHSDGSLICSALTGCAVQPLPDGLMGLVRLEYLNKPTATNTMGIQFLVRAQDLTALIGELRNLENLLEKNRHAANKPTGILS
jgi:hypothetical protein